MPMHPAPRGPAIGGGRPACRGVGRFIVQAEAASLVEASGVCIVDVGAQPEARGHLASCHGEEMRADALRLPRGFDEELPQPGVLDLAGEKAHNLVVLAREMDAPVTGAVRGEPGLVALNRRVVGGGEAGG